mgnify:CR=1 FL=1
MQPPSEHEAQKLAAFQLKHRPNKKPDPSKLVNPLDDRRSRGLSMGELSRQKREQVYRHLLHKGYQHPHEIKDTPDGRGKGIYFTEDAKKGDYLWEYVLLLIKFLTSTIEVHLSQ